MRKFIARTGRIITQKSKLLVVMVAGSVAAVTGTAVVMAAIPDSNGVIKACYSNGTPLFGNGPGAVRIIDSAATCKTNETSITWNQQGPKGDKGDNGATGPAGPQGPAGPAGTSSESIPPAADLRGGQLLYKNLSNMDLHAIDLSPMEGTSRIYSNLSGVNFSNSNLSDAKFIDVLIRNINFSGANLTRSTLKAFGNPVSGINFSNANLTDAVVELGFITDLQMKPVNLTRTELKSGFGADSVDLSGVDFSVLKNSSMNGVGFINSNLNNANFRNIHFSGSSMYGSTTVGADFTGATWTDYFCPDGTYSNDNGNTCIGHLNP